MADHHFQNELIRQLFLELQLPQARTPAITATAIAEGQEGRGLREIILSEILPPTSDHLHGELGGIRRLTDIDIAAILVQVVDAVRNCLADGFRIKMDR